MPALASYRQVSAFDPPAQAIVLCYGATGISTSRALAREGVDVHAFIFSDDDLTRYSRYGRKVYVGNLAGNENMLLEYLISYAKQLGTRPVVLPNTDAHALMLAKHSVRLQESCRVSTTSHQDLAGIINKDSLYRAVAAAGLPTVPAIYGADAAQIEEWSLHNAAPYFLKPRYEDDPGCRLRRKNLVIKTREALVNFVRANGTAGLIVQRLIRGGDDHIFDIYGYCDRNGKVRAMASHRRLRQYAPNYGTTSFGEIPSGLPTNLDAALFRNVEQLLRQVRYHGIFGIEWLQERGTNNFYLIDFNARPFLSIGHLHSCGVNLPLVAYRDLIGDSLDDVPLQPPVAHKFWINFGRDMQTFREMHAKGELSTWQWLRSIARCRSSAYLDIRDPGPGIFSLINTGKRAHDFLMAPPVFRPADL